MDLLLNISLKPLAEQITYRDKIMLTGSCFTEHIGNGLDDLKFSVLQNPNGILFDTFSVCKSLNAYVDNRQYGDDDIFYLNELWHSWDHHSRFSNMDSKECLANINASQSRAHQFLKKSDWLIITLGSSFSYRLIIDSSKHENGVANCHRAPAQWFEKHLLTIDESVAALDECCKKLLEFNPALKIIFTISPVRHIRDGVVENNRSKARLIESVNEILTRHPQAYYFPAYELVIDVLRDYRFYDIDLVHPNYTATNFVMEQFTSTCISASEYPLMEEIKKIMIASRHKAFQSTTNAHKEFLRTYIVKAKELMRQHAFIDLSKELEYFVTNHDEA